MGGTWCGVNIKDGDFCMLTNCWSNKMNPVENPITRGFIVSHFLTKEEVDFTYLRKDYDKYQGFNLIYGNVFDSNSFVYESNRTETIPQKKQIPIEKTLKDGIHVLTNSFINDTTWPKTEILTNQLKEYFNEIKEKKISVEELKKKIIEFMCLRPCPEIEKFPKYSNVQLGEYDETDYEGLGNIFIDTKNTKTRSQILLIVDKNQNVNYYYGNTENLEVNKKSVEIDQSIYKEFKFSKD